MAQTPAEIIQDGGDITITLTDMESYKLKQCESVIKAGLSTFLNVGQALATIRDNRLYRAKYDSFERYCKSVWDLSKGYAYKQINGYETVTLLESEMSPIGDISDEESPDEKPKILPINEAQTRPLTKLKKPEDQIAAWDIVLKRLNSGERLTAALIAKAVKEVQHNNGVETVAQTRQAVNTTHLVSNLFKKQYQVLLDIIVGEKSAGWQGTKRTEVVKYLKELIKIVESDD